METMDRKPITEILAENLATAMAEHPFIKNQNALAKKSGIAQTSIGLMLNPGSRAPTQRGRLPSPTLAQIDAVADALGLQAWQLIFPDPNHHRISQREGELYQSIEESMRELRTLQQTNAPYRVDR